MQHQPLTKSAALLPELQSELERVRKLRAFDPADYLRAKQDRLVAYFQEHGLKAAVVGMSGGVDSAVVLGILRSVETIRTFPLALPTHEAEVGQLAALDRIANLCKKWGVHCPPGNLFSAHNAVQAQVEAILGYTGSNWASGQLTSYIRTPALYYATSLLTDQGLPAVVIGTTNRDEGSYLGYVGKASDGMVDIQLIADLHKSEVYQLAKYLSVTEEIINAVPSGEMFDGRVDEEVFGAPYDFVELWLSHRCMDYATGIPDLHWSKEAYDQYHILENNLIALHNYNAHKYLVGSPAVHLNVLESAVPGGWKE